MKKLYIVSSVIVLAFCLPVVAQKASQSRLYDVCGDPSVSCGTSGSFGAEDLPIKITGELEWMGEYKSKVFYAVIVQSRKVIPTQDIANEGDTCSGQFSASERSDLQEMFPSNRVFSSSFGCYHFEHLYTNVNDKFNFLAVYAKDNTNARMILKKVRASGKYPGANVRRMQAILCNVCH